MHAGPHFILRQGFSKDKTGRVRKEGSPFPFQCEESTVPTDCFGTWLGFGLDIESRRHAERQASLEMGWGRSSPSKEPEDLRNLKLRTGTVRYGHPTARRLIILPAVPWW